MQRKKYYERRKKYAIIYTIKMPENIELQNSGLKHLETYRLIWASLSIFLILALLYSFMADEYLHSAGKGYEWLAVSFRWSSIAFLPFVIPMIIFRKILPKRNFVVVSILITLVLTGFSTNTLMVHFDLLKNPGFGLLYGLGYVGLVTIVLSIISNAALLNASIRALKISALIIGFLASGYFSYHIYGNTAITNSQEIINSLFDEPTTSKIELIEKCRQMPGVYYPSNPVPSNYYRGFCYKAIAKHFNDTNVCSNIEYEVTKKDCLFSIAKQTNDVGFCESHTNNNEKNNCLMDFAVKNKDIKICSRISDIWRENYCNYIVVTNLNDESLCAKVFSSEKIVEMPQSMKNIVPDYATKDTCYATIARDKKDSAICELIHDADKRKNDCLKDADDSMSPVGQQPTTSQYISPSTIKSSDIEIQTEEIYRISELGLEFRLPPSLNDLTHNIAVFNNDQAVNSVGFASRRLGAVGCGWSGISGPPLGYLRYGNDQGGVLVANARGSNLYYIAPGVHCGADISLQETQTQLLMNALRSLISDYKKL